MKPSLPRGTSPRPRPTAGSGFPPVLLGELVVAGSAYSRPRLLLRPRARGGASPR